MRNVLMSEYRTILAQVAARWGADPPRPLLSQDEASWTAPLKGISATLSLGPSYEAGGGLRMSPQLTIGHTSGLPNDAALALVVLRDSEAILQRALSALVEVDSLQVWYGNCPCDYCGGCGTSCNAPCKTCNGTGKRQEKEPKS